MAEQLRSRLAAASRLLAGCEGQPAHEAISSLQKDAVVDLIRGTELSPEVRAEASETVLTLKWHWYRQTH